MINEYIHEVAELLQPLPPIITKEELMNCYLHERKVRSGLMNELTVINLVQAANLIGVQIKGNSKLEVNVPIQEQWRYIRESYVPAMGKYSLKEMLENNKDDIVKAYESGATITELAKVWHCAQGTMGTYLRKFGAKMRKAGQHLGVLRETGKQKRRRRKAINA